MPLPEGFLASVDLIVPNQIEAAELTGESDPVKAAEALSAGNTWAIVTLGSQGSVIAHNGTVLGVAPARPVTAIDTTAAGDTFVGSLVARLASRGVELLNGPIDRAWILSSTRCDSLSI